MAWPKATDFLETVQDLRGSVDDEELRAGEVVRTPLGLPVLWSGNFADVFKIHCPATGNSWALKCFTREVASQRDRYRRIAAHLGQAQLPFTVDFQYLEQGIRIGSQWFPALKMRWVEGLTLAEFVEEHLDRPGNLKMLLDLWVKLAGRLREAGIAHADLQHGNVILVPMSGGSLALRLIDYDGIYVPALAGTPSGELGHPAYQHPQRLREGTYNAEVDRFSHLAIYTAIRCLMIGRRQLWQQFNNGDNLLFREADYRAPAQSTVFGFLWRNLPDSDARALLGRLIVACKGRLEDAPLLDEVVLEGNTLPLTSGQEAEVNALLAPLHKPPLTLLESPAPSAAAGCAVKVAAVAADREGNAARQAAPGTPMARPSPAPAGSVPALHPPPVTGRRAIGESLRSAIVTLSRPVEGLLRRSATEKNAPRILLWVLLPLALVSLAMLLAALFARSRAPLSPVAPSPAVYYVELEPPGAVLGTSGRIDATVAQQGQKWTVTVNRPDGKTPIALVATMPGYNVVRRELRPSCGEVETLPPMRLKVLPAVFSVAIEPAETVLQATGDKSLSIAHDGSRWTVTVNDPETSAAITLKANMPGYRAIDWQWRPSPGETRSAPSVRLKPCPAVCTVDLEPRGAVLEATGGQAASVTHDGSKWTVTVNEPDGNGPVIALAASARDYKPVRREWQPKPAESAMLRMTLQREPAIAFDLGGGVKLEMVLIPAGEFLMGSPDSDVNARPNEKPQHRVRITKPFYLGKYPVTWEQWMAVMHNEPGWQFGVTQKKTPASAGWDSCETFIGKLNATLDAARGQFQLPTEAQWEYACRAGSTSHYCFGDDEEKLGEYAWNAKNFGGAVHPVGQKKPNAWGLCDMHGYTFEWCQDLYDPIYYAKSPTDDPIGPAGFAFMGRVLRGTHPHGADHRSALRWSGPGDSGHGHISGHGLRACFVPGESSLRMTTLHLRKVPQQTVEAGKALRVKLSLEDADAWAGRVRYAFVGQPLLGTQLDAQTGEFTWTPAPHEAPGEYDVAVSVECPSDVPGTSNRDQTSFHVSVTKAAAVQLPTEKEIYVSIHEGRKLKVPNIEEAVFSGDGGRLATVSPGSARIWELTSCKMLRALPLDTHKFTYLAEFSPDGTRLATSSGGKVTIWDTENAESRRVVGGPKHRAGGKAPSVRSLHFSPDGNRLMLNGEGYGLTTVDVETGRELATSPHFFWSSSGLPDSVSFSSDWRRVATALSNGSSTTVYVHDVASREELHVFRLPENRSVNHLCLSSDGRRVAAIGDPDQVIVWDVDKAQELMRRTDEHGHVGSIAFSPDGRWLVIVGDSLTAWDVATGQRVFGVPDHQKGMYRARFSPDGRGLVVWGRDEARFWGIVVSGGQPLEKPKQP